MYGFNFRFGGFKLVNQQEISSSFKAPEPEYTCKRFQINYISFFTY